MIVDPSSVLSAYKKTGGVIDHAGADNAAAPDGASFSSYVKNFLGDAVSTMKEGENAATNAALGTKNDLAGLVTSISNAELLLTEITTIRDKAIAAYQTITSAAI